MARVVLEHLTKVFQTPGGERVHAVTDLCLTVPDQEFLVLVGPSGGGKTTILRLIAGLEEPTQGTVAIDGQAMQGVLPKDRDVAMVFQNLALYPHLSIFENLAFGLRVRKLGRAQIAQRVNETAELLELTECLQRLPAELSGGQRQRAAVGRAIVRRPRLFLFDEPLSDLDPPLRAQMRAELAKLHRRLGITMIYVTHDQLEAMSMGQRIVVLKDGIMQQAADPLTLYRCPANRFVAGFIGSPPMNFLTGSLVPCGEAVGFEAQAEAEAGGPGTALRLKLEDSMVASLSDHRGKQIVLGIRPEDVAVRASSTATLAEGTLPGVVQLIQVLGAETHLHLAVGPHSIVARLGAAERFAIGQDVSATLALRRAHFFDPLTGRALV